MEEGFEAALARKKRETPPSLIKIDGEAEAKTIALTCSEPPEGRCRWTLRLLASKVVELGILESISDHGIGDLLKNNIKPWLQKQWCIAAPSAEYAQRMEDVLEVYQRPYDEKRPVVCLDETNRQLIGETRTPRPVQPGQPAQHDYEYARNGVGNLFMMFEPLAHRWEVAVTERRTAQDFARCLRGLADVQCPDAETIVVVMDNLNTHCLSSLYATFEAKEARRLCERFEIHYTPKHGSWLNMAELEISVMSRQCLGRRIASLDTMAGEVQAWAAQRNREKSTVHWQFTTDDARIKLRHLYPRI